ncbi:MAG: VanZ family protein [Coraliomargarita sp.]
MNRAHFWPFGIMMSIIAASSASRLATPDLSFTLSPDKLAHFLVFGLLATSILRIPFFFKLGWHGALTAALIVSGCGILDEFRQSMTPGRVVELNDWVADTLGAIVAVLVYRYWPLYRKILEWSPWPQKNRTREGAVHGSEDS